MKLYDVIAAMEHLAPPQYACAWDKAIGVQLGSPDMSVKKVMVTLDVSDKAVEKAVKDNVDMIIAHHALFFDPLTHIDTRSPVGSKVRTLIKNDIAVFIAHTNLDAAAKGVNYWLAKKEGLVPEKCQVMEVTYTDALCKFVVFVPQEHAENVRKAMAAAGAGHIGNYSHCTFNTEGLGTFLPLEGTDPYIGAQGGLEAVDEVRIETIVPRSLVTAVTEAMKKTHPYEEVACDIYTLDNSGKQYGMGLVGDLERSRVIAGKKVKRLAVCGGGAGSLIGKAHDMGADAFIIGECSYHDMLYARELGLHLVCKGHYETEQLVVRPLTHMLQKELPKVTFSSF